MRPVPLQLGQSTQRLSRQCRSFSTTASAAAAGGNTVLAVLAKLAELSRTDRESATAFTSPFHPRRTGVAARGHPRPPPGPPSPPRTSRMTGVLNLTALIVLATQLFVRSVDPIVPQIAASLQVDVTAVALLSTAFALPFTLIQPVVGVLTDLFGKPRLMMICLFVVVASALGSALAPNYEVLFVSRVFTGLGTGGIFPVAMAFVADLVPVERRQAALARLVAGAMASNLFGATIAGLIGDFLGWRAVFFFCTAVGALILAGAVIGFRRLPTPPRPAARTQSLASTYVEVFRNPLAKFCYGVTFLEGVFMLGLFPYVAIMLAQGGETRASIAGFVLAGYGLGALLYSFGISRILKLLGERGSMRYGTLVVGAAMVLFSLRLPWQVDTLLFVCLGFGFYLLHGTVQLYATTLSERGRGSALALYSTCYQMGQTVGPIYYGIMLAQTGATATLVISAACYVLMGMVCVRTLRRPDDPKNP